MKRAIVVDEDLWLALKMLRDRWLMRSISDALRRVMELAGVMDSV